MIDPTLVQMMQATQGQTSGINIEAILPLLQQAGSHHRLLPRQAMSAAPTPMNNLPSSQYGNILGASSEDAEEPISGPRENSVTQRTSHSRLGGLGRFVGPNIYGRNQPAQMNIPSRPQLMSNLMNPYNRRRRSGVGAL